MTPASWLAALQRAWALQLLARPLCQMMTHMLGLRSCGAFLTRFALPPASPTQSLAPPRTTAAYYVFFLCRLLPYVLYGFNNSLPLQLVNACW